MIAPINSRKHILQIPINSVMQGTLLVTNAINSVKAGSVTADPRDVEEGAIVKAIFIELWLLAGSQQPGSVTLTFEKIVAGQIGMTFIESATLDSYKNKKNVLYTTQGLTPDANGNPVPFYRAWVKIPKGKQRFGLQDGFNINLSANVEDCSFCGLVIFKSYN